MKSPTEVKSVVRDTTIGDTLDSAINPLSEEVDHKFPASFIASGVPTIMEKDVKVLEAQDASKDIIRLEE